MMEFRRPKASDREAIKGFFQVAVYDTFAREGFADLTEDIENEINYKMQYFEDDLNTEGKKSYYILAFEEGRLIGAGAVSKASHLITDFVPEMASLYEVGSLFVHPDFQKRGIGPQIIQLLLKHLKAIGETEFCFDSGYRIARSIWRKIFGQPTKTIPQHWGPENDHDIWLRTLDDYIENDS